MAEQRLTVRVSHAVFDELDRRLENERGPNGEPSVNDFLTIDLLPIAVRSPHASNSFPKR